MRRAAARPARPRPPQRPTRFYPRATPPTDAEQEEKLRNVKAAVDDDISDEAAGMLRDEYQPPADPSDEPSAVELSTEAEPPAAAAAALAAAPDAEEPRKKSWFGW